MISETVFDIFLLFSFFKLWSYLLFEISSLVHGKNGTAEKTVVKVYHEEKAILLVDSGFNCNAIKKGV